MSATGGLKHFESGADRSNMALARTRRRRPTEPPTGWGMLISEYVLFALVTALFMVLGTRVPDGRADLSFLCLVGMGLHALAMLNLVERTQLFLARECAVCNENFHGFPERYPVPFRRHCAHCGADGAEQPASLTPGGSSDDATAGGRS